VVQHLPSKFKGLSSSPSTTKINIKECGYEVAQLSKLKALGSISSNSKKKPFLECSLPKNSRSNLFTEDFI
jgi:hypothetical protein